MDAIRTEHLTKKYDLGWRKGRLLALDKLNLSVHEGEVYGLLGPNGSGKSTTLKLILDLISPTEGNAWVFDVPCRKVVSRLHVGFLPENPYFYRYLTGAETLEFYGKLCGMGGAPKAIESCSSWWSGKRIDGLFRAFELVLACDRGRRASGWRRR